MDIKEVLGEELYQQVVAKIGDKKIIINDGSYIPIGKFNEINESNKLFKSQLEQLQNETKQIESLVSSNKDLSSKYQLLQEESKKQLENKDREFKNILKTSKIKDILNQEKAVYPELLMTNINLDNINIEGENLIGFNVNDIKTKFPDMFSVQKIEGQQANKSGFSPESKSKKDLLIVKYEEAEKNKDIKTMLAIDKQIKQLKE